MPDIVIIVGAPRSGTNMLRDVLTTAPGFGTWPCDEINLLWKHGNLDIMHDEIPRDRATPEVASYLHHKFAGIGRQRHAEVVVEKTCATSLRVPFAAEVFPAAKFIFIRRDGMDAAASSMKRWNAEFDLGYTMRKLRYVPPTDVPHHLARFAAKRFTQVRSRESGNEDNDLKVSTWWGPRPHDFRALQRQHTLEELAFIQWQRCVTQASAALAELPADQVIEVRYEEYVDDPLEGTRRILQFLGREHSLGETQIASVSRSSVGKGRAQLGPEAVERLTALGTDTLEQFGYVA